MRAERRPSTWAEQLARRGIRLVRACDPDPKRAAEALAELLLSKRRHVPGEGAGDSPERRTPS